MTPAPPSQTAGLIEARDWATTPLGPAAAWPERLRAVVDLVAASPIPMAVTWGSALVQLHNTAFARLFDLDETALGMPVRRAVPASPLDARCCDRVLDGDVVVADRAVGTDAVTLAYSPLRDDAGTVAGVLVTAMNVARTEPESELERLLGEGRARLAMAASSAGAWAWDAHSNAATWDDCYHAMYGFAPGEPRTHEAWFARLHPDDRAYVAARLETVRQTPGDDEWNLEFRAIVPGRGVVWMQGLGRAGRDADGTVRSMTGINLDITARKRIEQQLRASEEHLRLFFAHAPAAAAMFDREMRYVAVSRRWLSDFGLSDDVVGRCHYEVSPEIPPHWRAVHRRCLAGAVESAEEERFARADGTVHWLKWQVRPWHNDLGEIGGIIIVSEDITAARHAHERQRVLVGELQHRTRNLITVVESIAQQTMRTAASLDAFMARFSNRLRALARVQGLLSRSDRESLTIGGLVRLELEALGPDAVGAHTEITGPEVRLRKRDVQTLALAIHELATNACKYGALASERGRLSVTWRVEHAPSGERELALQWHESGVSTPATVPQPGYGWTLIERALPYSLAARTSLELAGDEFRCTIWLTVHDDQPVPDAPAPRLASASS